jgi:hypothetical protein
LPDYGVELEEPDITMVGDPAVEGVWKAILIKEAAPRAINTRASKSDTSQTFQFFLNVVSQCRFLFITFLPAFLNFNNLNIATCAN